MKYLLVGVVVFVVVLGVTGFFVCVAASRSDERHELMLRRQWREGHQ